MRQNIKTEQELIKHFKTKHPNIKILKEDYQIVPGYQQYGQGDLIVQKGDTIYVMEFKV